MNWGTKIIAGLATFMTFIVVLVLIMFNSKKDALVDNDYYEKGINYNKDYNRKEQVYHDHAKPAVAVSPDLLLITFQQQATGTIKLVRTADKNLDRSVPFESNSLQQAVVPVSALKKGSWMLIIDWQSKEKSYLYQQEINL